MKKCYLLGHKFEKNIKKENYWENDYRCIYHCGYTTARVDKSDKYRDTFWQSDAWYTMKFWFIVLFISLFVVSLGIGINYFKGNNICVQYKNMGIDVIYNFWTGCMANHPKFGWIPVEKYFEVLNLYVK